jgi:hypothetical protein
MRSGSFDAGKQVGTWTTYTRDGKASKETNFDKELRSGLFPTSSTHS